MRKQFKNKKRACALCKPFKRNWQNRWKEKDKQDLKNFEKEKNKLLVANEKN